MARLSKSPIYRIVVTQLIAGLFVSAFCLTIDWETAMSALLGGLVCVIPGGYVLMVSIRPGSDGGLGQVLKGQAGKYALSLLLFALVFAFVKPLNLVAFFGTFVGLQLMYAIVPWVAARQLERKP